ARVEELADQNWELRDAEERARSFVEAQGDVIVRRNADGAITYANDAFCALAGRSREALLASAFRLEVAEQGAAAVLADGTRIHDQRLKSAQGERWIAWREVTVRGAGEKPEIQSVGRDVTDRTHTERALADARDQAEPRTRRNRGSSPWSPTRSARRSTVSSAWRTSCSTRRLRPSRRPMCRRSRRPATRCSR